MAKDSWRGRRNPSLARATITTTLVVRDKRYIADGDNAIASLKAAIDGIVQAGILKDDKYIKMMPVRYQIDKERAPETILEITEQRNPSPQSRATGYQGLTHR